MVLSDNRIIRSSDHPLDTPAPFNLAHVSPTPAGALPPGFSVFLLLMQTVTRGPFTFRTRAQLDVIRAEFVTRTPDYGQALTSASINGQSYQFGTATYTYEEFAAYLQDAYLQLGVTDYGTPGGRTSTAVLR